MKKYLILILFGFQSLWAQVKFEANANKTSVGVNEVFEVGFTINADGDNFVPPNFEGFRIVAGPNQSVSQAWVNGRSSFQKTYSYYLLPTKKGSFIIKSATQEYNGQVYKTAPIKIKVGAAVAEDAPTENYGSSRQQIPSGKMNLVAEISNSNPYINEPITVVYKLYFSNIIPVSSRDLSKPTYNNFWSQNIEIKKLVGETGTYQGQKSNYVVLKKVVLYPQKTGKLTIEPLSLLLNVQMPTGRVSIFGDAEITETTKKVTTGTKTINVKALPEDGKPADFSGAVGRFEFKATSSRTYLKSGESLNLKISISGKGNLKLFDLPKPTMPNALEMYEPVHNENIQVPLSGMTGSVTDSYTIVPQFKGDFPIKPLSFSYFDLDSKSYKTLTTSEIVIHSLEGETMTANAPATTAKKIVASPSKFEFIKTKTTLEAINKDSFLGSKWFWILLLLPFLIIPILILIQKKREALQGDLVGNKIKLNNKLAKKYLSEAQKNSQNSELFYIALEKAMHNFLKAKLHIETSEMSKENIKSLLLSKNVNETTVNDFITLTENCDLARYASVSGASLQNDYEKAVAIISDLSKQI
jgi:hypothetical protein